jgi:flagellar motor protein MotB
VIIVGAAIGALIVGNPKSVLSKIGKGFGKAMKGPAYKKHDYIEFLSIQYQVFKMARSKGMFTLESHVESPDESDLFNQLPGFHDNHHAVAFMCDYLRMMSLGSEFPHEMEALMDEEIETHHHENHRVASAIQSMADVLPALGIVAAAPGVIKTMGSITEPPEVLGKLIGGAQDGEADVEGGGAVEDEDPDETANVSDEELEEELAKREEEIFAKVEAEIKQAIEESPDLKELQKHLVIDQTPEGLRIQIVDRAGKPMFTSGSSRMQKQTRLLLTKMAQVVRYLPNKISISGHTGSTSFRGSRKGYGNW